MSRSMKKRHTEQWSARTSRGAASRMSQRHLPTNAGQGRPAELVRCCGRKPQHCLRCDRSSPTDGVAAPGIAAGQTIPGSCASASSFFSSARAGPSHWACSSFFGRWSSAKQMTASSFLFRPEFLMPTEHIPNVGDKSCNFKWKQKSRFEI